MPSTKKLASAKRAPLPRRSDHARQFEKDWEKLTHSGKQDMERLKEVMMFGLVFFARAGTHAELFGR